jgi:hypothetical protein
MAPRRALRVEDSPLVRHLMCAATCVATCVFERRRDQKYVFGMSIDHAVYTSELFTGDTDMALACISVPPPAGTAPATAERTA